MEEKHYQVVVIDDDEYAADNLCMGLKRYARFSVEGMARNGASGKKLLEKLRPDLLFLDVELPDMKGMELVEQLHDVQNWEMKVVFYTAYDKYMIDAIRSSAFDYLLKPFDTNELNAIIDRFLQQKEKGAGPLSLMPPSVYLANEHTLMITTPTNDMRILRSIDIGYFHYNSERKLWEAMLNNQTSLFLRKNTTAQDILGYDESFVQIHQSYIINLNYLTMIQEGCCVLFPPFDSVTGLQISKKYGKELQKRFYVL